MTCTFESVDSGVENYSLNTKEFRSLAKKLYIFIMDVVCLWTFTTSDEQSKNH